MLPTPEEVEIGQKAYCWIQSHEKYGIRNLRQLPWILAASAIGFSVFFYCNFTDKHHLYPLLYVIVVFCGYKGQWLIAREREAGYRLILRLLKEKYGENLPWLMEEKQLAAARALEKAIAREHQATHA